LRVLVVSAVRVQGARGRQVSLTPRSPSGRKGDARRDLPRRHRRGGSIRRERAPDRRYEWSRIQAIAREVAVGSLAVRGRSGRAGQRQQETRKESAHDRSFLQPGAFYTQRSQRCVVRSLAASEMCRTILEPRDARGSSTRATGGKFRTSPSRKEQRADPDHHRVDSVVGEFAAGVGAMEVADRGGQRAALEGKDVEAERGLEWKREAVRLVVEVELQLRRTTAHFDERHERPAAKEVVVQQQ